MAAVCAYLCATALSTSIVQFAGDAAANAAPVAAPPPSAPASARTRAARVQLNITAIVNGSAAGEVRVETDTEGDAAVDVSQLVALLTDYVSSDVLALLRERGAAGEFVPISELNSTGFSIAFDLAALRLNVSVPLEAQAVNQLSIVDRSGFARPGLTSPENFSAGITITLADRFIHDTDIADIDREPFDMLVEGFANYGGVDGVNLAFIGGYREGGRPVRQRTTLFHDDVASAVRYSVGDIDPQAFGAYAVPVSMLGLGVERLYQTIQPFRNLRPAGRGALTLERPSRVDVLVNGTIYRTLDLAPGQYDIRDFPFVDGFNDVQLVVRDETGREELINLSFFSDIELLERGISVFSANFGLRQKRFGSFVSTAYEESPTFSGFYLRGVSDRLTLGGAAQLDRSNALVSGQLVWASPVGIFGVEAALDLNEAERAQGAILLSYRYQLPTRSRRVSGFSLDLQYRTARFFPMEAAEGDRNRFSWDVTGRYETDLGGDTFASFSAGYSWAREGFSDVRTAGVSLTRGFGRVNASAVYSYRHDERGTDHRAVFGLTVPLGPRQSGRAAYDTRRNRITAGYDLQAFEGLDQTDVRVAASRDDVGHGVDVEVEHFSNRFRAALRHVYERSFGTTRQVTDARLSFGLGYADGRVALGRDAADGFAIVERHRSLRGSSVRVTDSYSLGAAAQTGALGPALVPTRRSYQPNTLRVEVSDLPAGYDIGAGRYEILPGAASGYHIMIGSAASRTIMGRLLDSHGEPLAFATGRLIPVEGEGAAEVIFFTNRTGRMAATRVAPGRYQILLNGSTHPVGDVQVPEEGENIVNIGELRLGDSE